MSDQASNPGSAKVLEDLIGEILSFRGTIRDLPVSPEVHATEIREYLHAHFDLHSPTSLDAVFGEVVSMFRRWHLHVTHPRYFGLFNPSVTLGSIVGDTLAALYNPQLAVWSHSPVANEIETLTLSFLMQFLGFDPSTAGANFTSGGAEANFSATVVALGERLPGFLQHGAQGRRPRIYVSSEAHHSFHKTAAMAGIGAEAVRTIPVDDRLQMRVDLLEDQVRTDREAGDEPVMVVATAGTTSAGSVDPIETLTRSCENTRLWLHVDAAWGGSALLVPSLRPLFAGIDRSDSITWDAHKWLSVPMGAGMVFYRDREAAARTFAVATAYMPSSEEGTLDPYGSTVQWSRRTIGLKLFVSLATLGATGYQQMILRQIEMCDRLRKGLARHGWTILYDSPLAVVCFTHDRIREVSSERTFARQIQKRGVAWISSTVLGGSTPALRACVTSHLTDENDIDTLLLALEQELARI
ncbi:MAG TPA: aminotransferase class V-fold PLP-dependent enzyme [Thermoanaerobaculia bacterium]|nr:aminotransferase class V-fold PLP-dependent enzyme [Thermoanaerobaculia bacterium]